MTPSQNAHELAQDIAGRTALAAPPAFVAAWNNFSSIPAADWLTYLSILYVLLQAIVLIRKEFFKRKNSRKVK